MRLLARISCFGFLALAVGGCVAAEDDGSVTNDANEINEGRGSLERELSPPLETPKSDLIGAKMSDVVEEIAQTAKAFEVAAAGGCEKTEYKDTTTNKKVAERLRCGSSETVRFFGSSGSVIGERADLNKDGKVDRVTSEAGFPGAPAVAQYVDTNFDGEIDVIVERVADVEDFSMSGYDETFPKSKFLHRIREDRNRDGKLDFERLTARGQLPAAQ